MKVSENNRGIKHINEEYPRIIDVFRLSPIAIELYNTYGKLMDVNQACLDLFGVSKIEDIQDFNLFEDTNLQEQIIIDIRAGKAVRYEFLFDFDLFKSKKLYETTRIGTLFLECLINSSTNENNEIDGYLVHINDITERKLSQKAEQESKDLLSLFIKHSPVYAFIKNVTPTESRVLIASENYQDMIGIPGSKMVGKTMFDLFPAEYAEKFTADDWAVVSDGKIFNEDEDLNGRNYITIKFPIKQEAKSFLAGYTIDITKRRQAEEALQKSEEKFRRIVESSTSGMYFYRLEENDRLIFTGANPAADQILGFSHQLLLGKTIEEAFPKLASTKFPDIGKSVAKGEIGPQVFDIEYADELVAGFYNIRVFQTERNTITVNFTEISERRKAALLLEMQAKELQELNATKDKFLSIIAHDLKTPFGAIIGFSDLMLKKFHDLDDESLLKGLRTIENASARAYKLLENLLLWSQNQTGLRQFNPEKFNLATQISESLSMGESAAITKGIRVVTSLKKAYPVFADKNMIDSILRNLISNAIKFSHKGGKIKITVTKLEQELHISVSDNGVGISHQRLSAIFEIDKRTNTSGTDNEQGTGLGLILCKDFVTWHGGKIWVESTPGKGSTFTFSLKLN